MNCRHCQTEAPEGAKFCLNCGKKLPKPKPEPEVVEMPLISQVAPVLKPVEAAKLLGISRWKLDELRRQRKLPENCYFEIPSTGSGRKQIFRYRAKELIEWSTQLTEPITTAG